MSVTVPAFEAGARSKRRVPIAMVEIVESRLLQSGGEHDGHGVIGKSTTLADSGDRRGVGRLLSKSSTNMDGPALTRHPIGGAWPVNSENTTTIVGLPPDIPIILFVGNLLPVKGLDVLVEACSHLKRDGVKFSCLLIGQGPMRDRLERQIAGLQLQEQVRMLGPKPNEELAEWYRAATLFVLPSRSEGLPTVLREAAACGTPFVASRVGGIPEIAHLVPSRLVQPEDARGLAHAIREMIESPINHQERLGPSRQFPSHDESAAELSEVLEAHLCNYRGRATHLGPSRSPSELAS